MTVLISGWGHTGPCQKDCTCSLNLDLKSPHNMQKEIDSLRDKLKITEAALEEALTNVKTMGDTISYVKSQLMAAKLCFDDDHAYAARAWVSKALHKIRGVGVDILNLGEQEVDEPS